jgi:hypothetical protein
MSTKISPNSSKGFSEAVLRVELGEVWLGKSKKLLRYQQYSGAGSVGLVSFWASMIRIHNYLYGSGSSIYKQKN